MKKQVGIVLACIVIGLFVGSALSYRSGKDGGSGDFAMYVSPHVIAQSAACNWVTIHTDVGYYTVDAVAAAVNDNDVDVAGIMRDDRGYLVVKLRFKEVVKHVEKPSAVIELTLDVNGVTKVAWERVGVTN